MPKDVNIHIKTPGADDARKDIDKVAESAQQMGNGVQDAGRKSQAGSEGIKQTGAAAGKTRGALSGLRKAVLALGAAMTGQAIISGAKRIIGFFDEMRNKAEELVKVLTTYRRTLKDVYEATGAYSEAARGKVSKNMALLAQQAGTDMALTTQIADEYRRQFRETMAPEDYEEGRLGMLGYAVRSGGQSA